MMEGYNMVLGYAVAAFSCSWKKQRDLVVA